MLGRWILETQVGNFRLVSNWRAMASSRAAASEAVRSALFFARAELERRTPVALATVLGLRRELDPYSRRPGRELSSGEIEELSRWLESAVRSGALALEPVTAVSIRPYVRAPRPEGKPTTEARPGRAEELSWFEVTLIDEVGDPVDAVQLVFSVAGLTVTRATDGQGTARAEGLPGSFAAVRFASEAAVREKLNARWAQARGREWAPAPEGSAVIQVRQSRSLPEVSLTSEQPKTVVMQPRVVRARLVGTWFDTKKCFLLPTARATLPVLQSIYDDNSKSNLLLVGHTDRAGDPAYNDPLSLERADSMVAFLTDAVDDWTSWYSTSKPQGKRWGEREDELMIGALGCPIGADPVSWYQGERGMKVTGTANGALRKALVEEYMSLDGTTLPLDMTSTSHGCGENFPFVETPDATRELQNRRTELFFFDGPILPAPPGKNSPPGSKAYPEWVLRAKELYEFSSDGPPDQLRIRLHDGDSKPMTDVPYRLKILGSLQPEARAATGWIVLQLPSQMCYESIGIEWGEREDDGSFPYAWEILVECSEGTEREEASPKLHNLGYPSATDLEYDEAVRAFQEDYGIAEVGLMGQSLPPATRAKLWSIYEVDCDASRPMGAGGEASSVAVG